MFWVAFIAVFLTFQSLCLVILIRNRKVYQYDIDMIGRIHAKAEADIYRGRDWDWRYEELNSVSYNIKLFKFWRPVRSFYAKDPAREDR